MRGIGEGWGGQHLVSFFGPQSIEKAAELPCVLGWRRGIVVYYSGVLVLVLVLINKTSTGASQIVAGIRGDLGHCRCCTGSRRDCFW